MERVQEGMMNGRLVDNIWVMNMGREGLKEHTGLSYV